MPSGWWWVAGGAVGVVAVHRQRREARQVRERDLEPLGPGGRARDEVRPSALHRRAASWRPVRPATSLGRLAATLWAGPLSAIALGGGVIGGRWPQWDGDHGIALLAEVRGPFRWFLRAQSASAATLGQVVVLRDRTVDEPLLVHEAAHARQQERLGPLFALAYPLATAAWGYRANPFEVAARTAARQVTGPAAPA